MRRLRFETFFLKNLQLLLLAFLIQSCVTDPEPSSGALGVGDSLPSFSVTLNDGVIVSDKSLRGKRAVIVFFNTSCPDCRHELPVIQELYNHFREDGSVEILAIARKESMEDIENYWKDNSLSIPFSPQPDTKVYNLFASSSIPRIFIVSPEGIIRASFDDSNMPDLKILIDAVNEALE